MILISFVKIARKGYSYEDQGKIPRHLFQMLISSIRDPLRVPPTRYIILPSNIQMFEHWAFLFQYCSDQHLKVPNSNLDKY